MTLTAGVISLVSSTQSTANLVTTAASGGSGPYTQQWYRSTTTGFSPGGGNIITGATALTLADTGLVPNTIYYYKVVFTDTGNSNVTITAAQLAVTTPTATLSQNQFAQAPYIGVVDLRFAYNTLPMQVDVSQATALRPGSPVKMVDSAGGVPKVIGCAAISDDCLGFINYNMKNTSFVAGDLVEVSSNGNCIFLYATTAVARGAALQLDLAGNGVTLYATSGAALVGWAYDKATLPGDLIRVFLGTPPGSTKHA